MTIFSKTKQIIAVTLFYIFANLLMSGLKKIAGWILKPASADNLLRYHVTQPFGNSMRTGENE